jgi:hypothetical protein
MRVGMLQSNEGGRRFAFQGQGYDFIVDIATK